MRGSWLVAAGGVALAGEVLDQHDRACPEPAVRAVSDANFPLPRQRDDVVALGLSVPVAEGAWLADPEAQAGDGGEGRQQRVVFRLQFLKVRLAVFAGIDSGYQHYLSSPALAFLLVPTHPRVAGIGQTGESYSRVDRAINPRSNAPG